MKIETMFKRCQSECYDQEFGWSYQGHTGGNAVSFFFEDRYGVNLAAEDSKHRVVCELMAGIE